MKSNTLSWKFPNKEFLVLRIEIVMIAFLSLLVYVVTYLQTKGSAILAILFTALFLALYFLASYGIQRWRQVEEHYKLTKKHLEITHHKLDKTFLGGYLLTRKGKKHLLFFNTKDEVEKFESFLKKHMKRK